MALAAARKDIWEWCGVAVPVFRDTWNADVLGLSVQMLLRKHLDGHNVGLIFSEPDQVIGLFLWTRQFGTVHSFVNYDVTAYIAKIVSFGMLVWAFISEAVLCKNLNKLHGALLYQAVSLCHGFGLLDEDVRGFVKCVICVVCGCVLAMIIMLLRDCSD